MVNQKLLEAHKAKGWSYETISARIGVSRITYSRWINGHQEPQPSQLEALCAVYEMQAEDLGYGHLSREPIRPKAERKGVQPSDIGQHPFQKLTESELTTFTMLLRLGETMMFDPTKRKTLEALLAVMGAATIKPQSLFQQADAFQHLLAPKTEITKIDETMLQGFEQLIGACWQFSKGSDLTLAEQLLPNCMNQLIPVAQQPSKYQAAAAGLAAQGYQLYSIFALHHNDLPSSELYCKRAVQYSLTSENPNILVPSLRRLADTYRYLQKYPELLQTYLQALQYVDKVSPLLQSCVYRGVAVAYAYLGQKQEALRYIGLAKDTFPDHPVKDPSFSFAEFDFPWLIMGEGMTRSQIGQTKQALDVFNQIKQPGIIIPERARLEIINQQAKTTIAAGDLEQSSAYIEAGAIGAKALKSQRRYNEAYENFKQITLLWPQEKRVKELAELFSS